MSTKQWRTLGGSIEGEGYLEIIDEKGNCIARMSAGGNGPQLRENARMMVHAPELLSSLEYALDLIWYCLERNPSWVGNLPEAQAKVELAKARRVVAAAKLHE